MARVIKTHNKLYTKALFLTLRPMKNIKNKKKFVAMRMININKSPSPCPKDKLFEKKPHITSRLNIPPDTIDIVTIFFMD